MSRISLKEREALLHEYYRRFHQPRFLEWDPLLFVREFEGRDVQEYVALLAGYGAGVLTGGVSRRTPKLLTGSPIPRAEGDLGWSHAKITVPGGPGKRRA